MGLLTAEHKKCVGKVSLPLKVDVNRSDITGAFTACYRAVAKRNILMVMRRLPAFIFNLFTPLVPLATLGKDGLKYTCRLSTLIFH